ncbi:hypothetical protein ACGC1H_002003 [Rhizoctonia solani]|uniref:F-box domain-containing protein n=1 Tax=Rhizoctonia solani TaxID=456999 RepID=A0A8H3AWJ5_9AGAM|nr:unnamed protein product [Rhizoctonia solani]
MVESEQPSSHFDSLSNELIVQILHFCQYDGILRFAATSKRHYNILADSVSLKLHIELDANGLDIIKGSRTRHGTYFCLLEELVRYRDAWLNLDLEVPIERNSNQVMSLWELREGNYVVAFSSIASTEWGPDSIQVTPIDSLESPQPISFPSAFSEFTLDFEQGLAALVKTDPVNTTCLEIRLCSTITGLPHPLARSPRFILQVDFPIPGPGHQTFTLEVIDNILVIRIADILRDIYEIIAWDWKTGALLCRVGSSSGVADFALLDNRHLALFSAESDEKGPRSMTISLYSMLGLEHGEIPSGPYFCASKCACARPILTFKFPKLDDSYIVSSRVIMRSDPIPGRITYTKSASLTHQTALTFSVILSLLHISNPDEDSVHLRIFISAKHLGSYLLGLVNEQDTVVIPWSVWGSQASRWFLCDKQTSYWVYWTSGSRFICVDEDPHSMLHSLSVFDFHSPTVRRHALRDTCPSKIHQSSLYKEEMREIVLKGMGLITPHPVTSLLDADLAPLVASTIDSDLPTVIETGFSSPVESRLPYRVVTRPKFVPSCEDWSIDGDHIIGMTPVRPNVDRLSVYKLRT